MERLTRRKDGFHRQYGPLPIIGLTMQGEPTKLTLYREKISLENLAIAKHMAATGTNPHKNYKNDLYTGFNILCEVVNAGKFIPEFKRPWDWIIPERNEWTYAMAVTIRDYVVAALKEEIETKKILVHHAQISPSSGDRKTLGFVIPVHRITPDVCDYPLLVLKVKPVWKYHQLLLPTKDSGEYLRKILPTAKRILKKGAWRGVPIKEIGVGFKIIDTENILEYVIKGWNAVEELDERGKNQIRLYTEDMGRFWEQKLINLIKQREVKVAPFRYCYYDPRKIDAPFHFIGWIQRTSR